MTIAVAHDIEVRAVRSADELSRVHELMARCQKPPYDESLAWLANNVRTYPGFLPEHTRVAWRAGEIAGGLRITTETIRLGEARLKMGGIGWVSTAPEHRRNGVADALLRDALRYMQHHGYHVSMLFGIPNYYTRFGYTTCLAEHFVTVPVEDIPRVPIRFLRTRPVKAGDVREVQRIHESADRNVACSPLRNAGHIASRWDRMKDAQVFLTQEGRVAGYVLPSAGKDVVDIHEISDVDADYRPEMLAWCASHAAQHLYASVRFHLPPEHPFAVFLRGVPSKHETRYVRDRDGMMCLVDIGETLENLVPDWESRLREYAVASERTELTLLVDGRPFRVRSNRGAIDIAAVSGRNKFSVTAPELVRLITGYDPWEDVYGRERRLIAPATRALFPVLFPKRNPYVHRFDRF